MSPLRPPNPLDFSAEWRGGQRTPAWDRLWNRLLTDVPVYPDIEVECAKNQPPSNDGEGIDEK